MPILTSVKSLTLLLLSALLAACANRPREGNGVSTDEWVSRPAVAAALQTDETASCDRDHHPVDPSDRNTVFVHPGLLMLGVDWGGQRAVDTGLLLVRDGYAGGILEIRSRQGEPIYHNMLEDPGERFLGIHYSMGGAPQTIAKALQATEQASKARQQKLTYNLIMVEPFGFDRLHEVVDLDSPHFGRAVVLVSSDNTLLRPDIEGAPPQVLNHPKLHVLYPEDFGLYWDHFSILSDLREAVGSSEPAHQRAYELFLTVADSLRSVRGREWFDGRLARLKLRYAAEDNRPVRKTWLEQLSAFEAECKGAAMRKAR